MIRMRVIARPAYPPVYGASISSPFERQSFVPPIGFLVHRNPSTIWRILTPVGMMPSVPRSIIVEGALTSRFSSKSASSPLRLLFFCCWHSPFVTANCDSHDFAKCHVVGCTGRNWYVCSGVYESRLILTVFRVDVWSGFWGNSALLIRRVVSSPCPKNKGLFSSRCLGFLFFRRPSLPVALGTRLFGTPILPPQHCLVCVSSL